MTESNMDLTHLLELALDRSVESRRILTSTLGDFFNDQRTVLTERERALMSDILSKLIRDCEMAVRRDLSERLAKAKDPPRDLIVALANDEIEVARPVLMASDVLRDMELIQVIRRRTHQHQLAIAMRRTVTEPVSDALVETGDVDVIKTLLENQDARISDATMQYLAEESRRVDTYQEPLIKRRDLSPVLAKRMYRWVSAALRQHILDHFQVDPVELDDQLEQLPEAIVSDSAHHSVDPETEHPAAVLARRLAEKGQITWQLLTQTLRQGEVPLFEALFGELSGLRTARVQRVLYDSGGDGLAIACRALGMPKAVFATTYLLSRRARGGSKVTDPRALSRALIMFDKLNQDSAKEVLKSWRRGEDYQDAVEQVAAARAGSDD